MLEGGLGSVDGVTSAGGLQVETDIKEAHDGLMQSEVSELMGRQWSGGWWRVEGKPQWFAVNLLQPTYACL